MQKLKCFLACVLAGVMAAALPVAADDAGFEAWKQGFRAEALQAGIEPAFLDGVLPQMTLLPQVVASDRKQPEFISTFWDYTARALSPHRIQQGREMMRIYARELAQIEKKYGVQAHYIVAFWGMETNYGSHKGSTDTLQALTTLAYDTRRRAFFTRELIAFLKMMQQEGETGVKGSWAGAFGHFQFMPTTFQAYAADGDGDGKKDIVRSLPDAFSSAGNYLAKMGWDKTTKWGREVRLTRELDWELAHSARALTVREWAAQGVFPAYRDSWPEQAWETKAQLVMPMGVAGPVFLTYPNFKIIMRWNRSELYALAIGLLADKLSGQDLRLRAVPTGETLTPADIRKIQTALKEKGYYEGGVDGQFGSGTRAALRAYQKDNGFSQDGYATQEIINKLVGYNK